MNVLQEIGLSYARIHDSDLDELSEGYEDSYSYIISEIIETDFSSKWRKESYPEEYKWAQDNNLKLYISDGNGEGEGEYCERVFSWKDKFYKIEFSYYSHYGYQMDGVEDTIQEVKPVEKTVVVYE